MAKLQKQVTSDGEMRQCSSVNGHGNKKEAFRNCKRRVQAKLEDLCSDTKVKRTGELLYCYDRGLISCCFYNHSCAENWTEINEDMYDTARNYLEDPKAFLSNLQSLGYKSCHPLNSSLDASICAEDCKKLEKKKFAQNCTNSGGLFKCCIRRDAAMCHECRFCCTLPMCTMPPDRFMYEKGDFDKTRFEDKEKELDDNTNKKSASEKFNSVATIYKSTDYRCLKPYSHKDPTKWRKYDMHAFRRAFDNYSLSKVDSFKYDNNFFNWIDPNVMKQFVSKSYKKVWRETYGFHNTFAASDELNREEMVPCFKKCAKLEKTKFAEECHEMGGLFKCCVNAWNIKSYEETRNKLIRNKLIKDIETTYCDTVGNPEKCNPCMADGFCSIKDKKSGKVDKIFINDYKKEHRAGGNKDSFEFPSGLRFSFCAVGYICQRVRWYYDDKAFRDASTKEELCDAKYSTTLRRNRTEEEISKMKQVCMKQTSNVDYTMFERTVKKYQK